MQSKHPPTSNISRSSRPKPKRGYVPPQALGDILQIWNFFHTFSELFKCDDIQKEEIFTCLNYQGEEVFGLINDMHQGLLSLYLQEFIKKNKFEALKDRTENPFFVLLKHHVGTQDLNGDELALIWTEFARKLAHIHPCDEALSETTKRFFEALGKKTCLNYNSLEYRQKIKILINLIDALYETDVIKGYIQEKLDECEASTKERNELLQEIKGAEQTLKEAKASAGEITKQGKTRNALLIEIGKQEEKLSQKRARLAAISSEKTNPIQTASFVGVDVHKSEYWIFHIEPTKLYVRYPEIVSTEEEWYYYDTKAEIDLLIKSLNTKGIKEKQLLENIQEFISNGKLILQEGTSAIELDKENMLLEDRSNPNRMEEDRQVESNYWFAKALEYDEPVANSRLTRKKIGAQRNKNNRKYAKTHKDLNQELIKTMIIETEERLNIYLQKWDSWWALPKAKEEVMNRLIETQDVLGLRDMLLEFNQHFRFGISLRNKYEQSADTNSTEDRSKLSEEGKDEDDLEGSEDGRSFTEEIEEDSRRSKDSGDKKVTSGQTMDLENIQNLKTKKYPMRFWGMYTDKLRSSWLHYTSAVDNISGLYFAAVMFCDAVDNYVEKMTIRYFTHYASGREYMESKWKSKKQAVEVSPIITERRLTRNRASGYREIDSSESPKLERRQQSRGNRKDINLDNLDSYRHAKKVVVKKGKDSKYEGKSTVESESYNTRSRRNDRSGTPSEERVYPTRAAKNQGNHKKLEELATLRKSSRVTKMPLETKFDIHEEEEYWNNEESLEYTKNRQTRRSTRRIS